MAEKQKFYFTYGSEGQDFQGGWTEIAGAESFDEAVDLFCVFHPRSEDGFIRCGGIYAEDNFKKTIMYKKDNFGKRCVETISIERNILEDTK